MARYFANCELKKHYDTEFEATIACAKSGHRFKAELIPYPCGPHWHITHKDPAMRGKFLARYRCPHCKQIINRNKNPDHGKRCTLKP